MSQFYQDVRYTVRMLGNSPGFTAITMLILAVGIGGNTAVFTAIRALLLSPLGFRDPDRLVYVSLDNPRRNGPDSSFTLRRFEHFKTTSRSFTGVAAFLRTPEKLTLSGTAEPEAINTARVSANFFEVLGIQPILGRSFAPEED